MEMPDFERARQENPDVIFLMVNATDGVLGSELVGAGLGGCVVALVRKDRAAAVMDAVNVGYYDRFGYPHAAVLCSAACGSSVMF